MNVLLRLIILICLVFAGQSHATTTAVAYGYEANSFQAGVENINNNGLINPSGCCRKLSSRDSQDRAQARSFFALTTGFYVPKETKSLYHYTDDAGLDGILSSKKLNPSLKANNPKDARFGDGQYLSDIAPGTKTCAQLSRCFIGQPFQGNKFKNYVEIDVTDLNVVRGRDGVFVLPNDKPLDLTNRILGSGAN